MRTLAIVNFPIAMAYGEADRVGAGQITGNAAAPRRIGPAASSACNTLAPDAFSAGDTRTTGHRR
jgi:hypothetical protein